MKIQILDFGGAGGAQGLSFLLGPIGGIGKFLGNIPKTRRCDGDQKFILSLVGITGGSLGLGPEGGIGRPVYRDGSSDLISEFSKFVSVASRKPAKRRTQIVTTGNKFDFVI
ncbi:unnamed protein product [Brassica napus]|uniref:(rape) hypothetical protein n=1 Tax=Brassica napus TaxID=3708 RepID=A0A817BGL3_BRANA|nr:unnamed protein product [Brassica napus]